MRDFIDRIVGRARGTEPTIQPRIPSRFERPEQHLVSQDAPGGPEPAEDAGGAGEGERRPAPARTASPPVEDGQRRLPASGGALPVDPAIDGGMSDSSPTDVRRDVTARPPVASPASGGRPAPTALGPLSSAARLPTPSLDAGAEPPEPSPRHDGASVADESGGPPRRHDTIVPDAGSSSLIAGPPTGSRRGVSSSRQAFDMLDEIFNGPTGNGPTGQRPPGPPADSTGGSGGEGPRAQVIRPERDERGPDEITIAIDRIDVRGLAPAARPAQPARRGPRLTLGEYMRQHGQGKP